MIFKTKNTRIRDVKLILPDLFPDERGCFLEIYQENKFAISGMNANFIQDNIVHSRKNVFRGLHFQKRPYQQAKLVTVITGKIIDFVLDIRPDSPDYLKCISVEMSAKQHEQLYIPTGLAHGYYVVSDEAWIHYKVSNIYSPDHESGVRWDDSALNIKDMIPSPILSEKDQKLPGLNEI